MPVLIFIVFLSILVLLAVVNRWMQKNSSSSIVYEGMKNKSKSKSKNKEGATGSITTAPPAITLVPNTYFLESDKPNGNLLFIVSTSSVEMLDSAGKSIKSFKQSKTDANVFNTTASNDNSEFTVSGVNTIDYINNNKELSTYKLITLKPNTSFLDSTGGSGNSLYVVDTANVKMLDSAGALYKTFKQSKTNPSIFTCTSPSNDASTFTVNSPITITYINDNEKSFTYKLITTAPVPAPTTPAPTTQAPIVAPKLTKGAIYYDDTGKSFVVKSNTIDFIDIDGKTVIKTFTPSTGNPTKYTTTTDSSKLDISDFTVILYTNANTETNPYGLSLPVDAMYLDSANNILIVNKADTISYIDSKGKAGNKYTGTLNNKNQYVIFQSTADNSTLKVNYVDDTITFTDKNGTTTSLFTNSIASPQPTQAPPQPTQAPPQPTQAPPQPTQAPPQPTSAPYQPPQPTQAPPQPTSAPYQPPQPTSAPYQPPEAPYQQPEAPYQLTSAPYQQPEAPYQLTSAPYQQPEAPYQLTSAPYQQPEAPYQPPSEASTQAPAAQVSYTTTSTPYQPPSGASAQAPAAQVSYTTTSSPFSTTPAPYTTTSAPRLPPPLIGNAVSDSPIKILMDTSTKQTTSGNTTTGSCPQQQQINSLDNGKLSMYLQMPPIQFSMDVNNLLSKGIDYITQNMMNSLTHPPVTTQAPYNRSNIAPPISMDKYMLKTQMVPPVCPTCSHCSNGVPGGGVCSYCGGKGGSGCFMSGNGSVASNQMYNPYIWGNQGIPISSLPNGGQPITNAPAGGRNYSLDLQPAVNASGNVVASVGSGLNKVVNKVGQSADSGVRAVGGYADSGIRAVGGYAEDAIDTVGQKTDKLIRTAGGYVDGGVRTAGDYTEDVVDTVGQKSDKLIRTAGGYADGGVRAVGGYADGGVRAVGGYADGGVRAVGGYADSGVRAVGGYADGGVRAVGGYVDGAIDAVVEDVDDVIDTVGENVDGVVRAVGGYADGGVRAVGGYADGGVRAVGGYGDGGVRAVGGYVDGGVRAVGGYADGVVDTIVEDVDDVIDTVGENIDGVVRTVGGYADSGVRTVGGYANSLVNTVGYDIEQSADSIRKGVRNVGSDINEGANIVAPGIGQFLNSVGSMAHSAVSTVGSDLNYVVGNSVVGTSGTNVAGVMNYLGNGVKGGQNGIGSLLDKQNSQTASYSTTPAPTGSILDYNQYGTSSGNTVVSNFTDLYGANPSAVYRNVKKTTNYDKPIRKGIPSPSGPWFSGMNGQYGNAPGAQGGPKMDPYSYFGNVPSKGWANDPAPYTYNFSKFQ